MARQGSTSVKALTRDRGHLLRPGRSGRDVQGLRRRAAFSALVALAGTLGTRAAFSALVAPCGTLGTRAAFSALVTAFRGRAPATTLGDVIFRET